jgi:hypothetical protein
VDAITDRCSPARSPEDRRRLPGRRRAPAEPRGLRRRRARAPGLEIGPCLSVTSKTISWARARGSGLTPGSCRSCHGAADLRPFIQVKGRPTPQFSQLISSASSRCRGSGPLSAEVQRIPRLLAGLKSLLIASSVAVVAAGCGSTTVIQGGGTQPTLTRTVIQQGQANPPATSSPPATSGLRSCGGNLSANPHTSCPFAQAVYRTVAINNGSAQGTYSVYSSVTGRSYSMTCGFEQTEIVCRGGSDAVVVWPG